MPRNKSALTPCLYCSRLSNLHLWLDRASFYPSLSEAVIERNGKGNFELQLGVAKASILANEAPLQAFLKQAGTRCPITMMILGV